MLNKSNRFKTKSVYAIYALFSSLMFLAALYFMDNERLVSVLVSMGTATIAIAILRSWKEKKGELLSDERTKKVNRAVMSASLSITYLMIAGMILINYFGIVEMSAEAVLSILLFTIAALQIVLKAYFSRKGDIE